MQENITLKLKKKVLINMSLDSQGCERPLIIPTQQQISGRPYWEGGITLLWKSITAAEYCSLSLQLP